jgi:hypothetical protein
MPVQTIRGIVENGKVRLTEDVALPENTSVLVIIADSSQPMPAQIRSPRLANPQQADDFRKQIVEISDHAGL